MTSYLYWLPALGWAGFLFWLSSQSSLPGEGMIPDYPAHFGAYLILAVLCRLGFAGGKGSADSTSLLVGSWVLATAYGLSDEFHQFFTPHRQPSWSDVVADSLGALTGVLLLAASRAVWTRCRPESEDHAG